MPYIGAASDWSDFEHPLSYQGHAVPVGSEVFATSLLASGYLKVVNRTALHFQLLASYNQSVIDEVWLTRG